MGVLVGVLISRRGTTGSAFVFAFALVAANDAEGGSFLLLLGLPLANFPDLLPDHLLSNLATEALNRVQRPATLLVLVLVSPDAVCS